MKRLLTGIKIEYLKVKPNKKVDNSTKVDKYAKLLTINKVIYISKCIVMKKCIYVVEDNAGIRDVIEFLLTEEQYEVITYPNINAFWKQMQNHIPDMVILDIMLPDGNGLDVCNQLKSSLKTHDLPIMMMSANNHLNQVKSKCLADEYINKPFDLDDFAKRIDHYVSS
jgi:DNA-binding response OmpR family regulator